MRNKWIYVAMLVLSFSFAATACDDLSQSSNPGGGNPEDTYEDYKSDKQPGGDQFDHDGNYVAPELTIDGKGEDAQWKAITEPLATFGNGNAATVKAYRGDNALFFLFEVQDKILLTEGETNDDAVTRSDSIEFYLDTLADGGLKPQSDDYQINLGIHGKTRIMQGSGSGWGNWNGLIDYEVSLNGTLNDGVEATDTGYSVEVMIPYTQINIEKDDTIAISFGQVDKVGAGNAATTDWDWYPWIYNGVITEPQTPNNYVLLDKDNGLMARDEETKPNAEMAGYVLDSTTATAIDGATVTVEIGGETQTTTTDASGFFSFANVDPESTYTVTVSKDGYISNSATYTREELRAANGGRVQKDITIINETTVARTKLTGTVKNLVNGTVGDATIRIEGTVFETTANADGVFEIANVPVEEGKDITIIVSKAGYGDSKTLIEYGTLVTAGDAVTELGDVNINLPYAQTGGFGNKSDFFADSSMTISRTLTGIEFNLTGTRQLNGHIEVYVDTKDCADLRDNDTSFWCFNLSGDGFVTGNHYAGGNFTAEGLEYTLYKNDASGYSARFFVPYTYLGITPFEVFGVSLGQWSTTANDWDGWGFNGQFVAPETPEKLIRLSATNELYREDNNTSMVNLSGNVGIQGVRVTVGTYATTSGADGSWNMKVPATSEAINIVYSCLGYEPKTTEIAAGYFDTHYGFSERVELEMQRVSLSGTVTDSITGDPVEGVTVTVDGTEITATTNANGEYTLTGISTSDAITVSYVKEGYATQTKDFTAETLAGAVTHTQNIAFVSNEQVKYITLGGTVTNVNGAVAGATVTVEGTEYTATTNENGVWSIENFKGVDSTVSIAKDGYVTQTMSFKADNLEQEATAYDMGGVDMPLNFVEFGALEEKADETKRAAFAGFKAYATRTATAFEFKFIGTRAFANGPFEFYLDLGASNARDYQFIFRPDGTLTVNHFTGTNTSTADLTWSMKNVETAAEIYLTIPYSYLGVQGTDVIGVGAGQWSDAVSDWDGMFSHNAYVEVGNAEDYVRLTSTNDFYRYATNNKTVVLSGNAGAANVTVAMGGVSTVSDANGVWSLRAPLPTETAMITYSRQGYVSQTQLVEASEFTSGAYVAENVTLAEQKVTVSGTITDEETGAALAGVVVSVSDTDITTTTDVNGNYSLELGTFNDVTLKFTLADYTASDVNKTAAELAAAATHTVDVTMLSTNQIKYVKVIGTVTNVNGPVAGATVALVGNSEVTATTDTQGRFEIANFAAIDSRLTVTKDGYIATEIAFLANDVEDGAAEYDLGEVDMMLEYGEMQGLIGDLNENFAAFKGYVTRSAVGFEFKFVGSRAFTGRLELFVDTKESSEINARDTSDYLFNLNADGTITIVNWGEGEKNETVPSDMLLTVKNADTTPEVYFTLPYAFLRVTATEVIGISAGQYSATADAWEGWDNFALIGVNGSAYVAPEWTQDYIRIAADNTMYAKADNATVDFSSYQIHFATGQMTDTAAGALGNAGLNADDMYAKVVSRDENGVTFEIITTGNFGTDTETNEKEMILIYFDTGSESKDGWQPDYLIKIFSDGTVYGKASSAWWSATESDKLSTTATITTENGVTKIVYTVSYETIGIGATDVFGIAMREASHNGGDHKLYDPWYDCYFENETTGIDAAACTQYIRVSADGTLYKDNNNDAND